jgi:multiple sugar transport system permease protein
MTLDARPTLEDVDQRDRRGADQRTRRTLRAARRRQWGPIISQGLLTVVLFVFMLPFLWMLSSSLKPLREVFASPPRLLPREVRWENYLDVWTHVPFARFILNGVVVSLVGTLLVCATSVLAAYAFARLRFRVRDILFFLFLTTLMVPQEVVVVPMFILMQQFGWVDSYPALILPWAFTAFGIFLLRQFFLALPRELEEAALVDGAGRLRALLFILVPMAKPAIGVLAVFTFIQYWNMFLWPLIIINRLNMNTVPLGLNSFMGQMGNQWHLLMAAATISMIPTAAVVIALQRHLIKGIALSGIAGR